MAATLHRHTGADTGPSGDCFLVQAIRAVSSPSPLSEGIVTPNRSRPLRCSRPKRSDEGRAQGLVSSLA